MQYAKLGDPALVGFARTSKISELAPSTEPADVIRVRRMDYYSSMAGGEGPTAAVIEDMDFPNCIDGWWGEVNVAIHRGRGLKGAVTNGGMHDLDVLDDDFPVFAGSIGLSHGFVHVVEIGTAVNVMGLNVAQDDLIHADRHGALVIPSEVTLGPKQAIENVFANESIVLESAHEPSFDIKKLEEVWAKFEAQRT